MWADVTYQACLSTRIAIGIDDYGGVRYEGVGVVEKSKPIARNTAAVHSQR